MFFDFCVNYNFKSHPNGCSLLLASIRWCGSWCGRVINHDCIPFEPLRIDRIRHMISLKIVADMQSFVYAIQWMTGSFQEFFSAIHPRDTILKAFTNRLGKELVWRRQGFPWGPSIVARNKNTCSTPLSELINATLRLLKSTHPNIFLSTPHQSLSGGAVPQIPIADMLLQFVD